MYGSNMYSWAYISQGSIECYFDHVAEAHGAIQLCMFIIQRKQAQYLEMDDCDQVQLEETATLTRTRGTPGAAPSRSINSHRSLGFRLGFCLVKKLANCCNFAIGTSVKSTSCTTHYQDPNCQDFIYIRNIQIAILVLACCSIACRNWSSWSGWSCFCKINSLGDWCIDC
jgi:hypothetical protein